MKIGKQIGLLFLYSKGDIKSDFLKTQPQMKELIDTTLIRKSSGFNRKGGGAQDDSEG